MSFMSEQGSNQRKWIVPVVAGSVLLVLSLIALFREPVVLDRSTAEGTVQAFLQAIDDNDLETAHDQLSPSLQEECSTADISSAGPYDDFTATLGDIEEFDNETIVHVSLRLGDGSSFDGYGFDPGPYRLELESGTWGITEIAWPYFYFECGV